MSGIFYSDERQRRMYPGGRADATARRLSHFWARVFRMGLLPRRWVTLEVTGRASGLPVRFPLGMARSDGDWYVVSMLGEHCNWVRNVRAAGGEAVLRRRAAVACQLVEVAASERGPILKRYLEQVPGGRPHIAVDRRAPVAAFAAVADLYPVFRVVPTTAARRHRRWPWLVAGLAAIVVLGGIATMLGRPASGTPRLMLPAASTTTRPAGSADGAWLVSQGSVAGFRVAEEFVGMSDDVVGRTTAVTGGATVAGDSVTAASFTVDLRAITVRGKAQPQFEQSLGVAANPDATFTLTEPLLFGSDPSSGGLVTARAHGNVTLHGVTRPVTFAIRGRYTGSTLVAVGAIPVTFSDYGIAGPQGYGALGSLANHGEAEFLLVLRRA
jgi:deazaflavin-dependent oxidoreductase (nitroreductase family)